MASSSFKPLSIDQQTIVITGASHGIGLYTASLAASSGANVVMVDGNRDELRRSSQGLTDKGFKVQATLADVTRLGDMMRVMDEAIIKFGQINTWINSDIRSSKGYILDINLGEEKELFDINFWGTRLGSSVAVMAMEDKGGTLINIGNEVGANLAHGIYRASTEAIKSFNNSLRIELKDREIPVQVCFVRPTGEYKLIAEAILRCAVYPQRDTYLGGPAKLTAIIDTLFPGVIDIVAESKMKEGRNHKRN